MRLPAINFLPNRDKALEIRQAPDKLWQPGELEGMEFDIPAA